MNNDSAKIKNILREGITLEPYFLCEHCKEGIVIEENHFCEYFKSDFIKCNNCEKKSDLWLQILELIRTKNLFLIFNAIGAKTGHFSKLFKPGQRQTINFEGYGLPKDGKILFINYTTQGDSLSTCEINFGNSPKRYYVPRVVNLMPIPIADKTPQDTDVAICFIWIEMKDDHVSWEHLVHAFENFSNKQYESMIIPANIAVESRTTRILKNILMKTAGKDNVEDCLKQSYGHNLNVIFPAILKPRSINFINDTIRGKLNRLKDLRNNLVHDGKLSKEIKDEEAEEIICAAIFGFYYMKYIENLFNE